MDLGISGRKAIVCGSSRGIGKACALALAEAGASLIVNGRKSLVLDKTATEIRTLTDAEVTPVTADITTAEGQGTLLAACPNPDILVTNNGAPPYRSYQELDRETILEGLIMNMVTPIEIIQAVIESMTAQRFGRIVRIPPRVEGWGSFRRRRCQLRVRRQPQTWALRRRSAQSDKSRHRSNSARG